MSQKLMPRLGSAIASTILSLFWAVSLVGVDQAQAATLTYNLQVGGSQGKNFFKVNNSSLTGIGEEYIAVSEGKLYGFTVGGKEYDNLAGVAALVVLFCKGRIKIVQLIDDRERGMIEGNSI